MKLNEYMPPFLRNVREFKEIFNSEDFEIDELNKQIEKMLTEIIVKTADSYGLERYEKIYNITNTSQTIEARRMAILLKMNNRTQYTYKWLVKTLNEAIGKDNYKITNDFNNYSISIEIVLNYTEAAEILKRDLVKQIPSNILLNYKLISKANQNIAGAVCQQSYIHLIGNTDPIIEDLKLIQNNNIALSSRNQEYINLTSNQDIIKETEYIQQKNNVGITVSGQEFINIKECEK